MNQTKIKVLMFGWEFPPHNSGGLGVACKGLVQGLIKEDIELNFVLPKKIDVEKTDKFFFHFADEPKKKLNIKIIPNKITPYIISSKILINGKYIAKTNFNFDLLEEVLAYEKNAAKLAAELDFDVIHAHDWLSFGAGIKAKEVSGKPLIAHVHATEFDRSGGNEGVNEYVYQKEREGFQKADKIITVSGFTKNLIQEKYGADENKIEVIHNGIDIDEHIQHEQEQTLNYLHELKKQGKKIILFLGRITIQKNPEGMLRIAERVIHMNKDAYFVFAGSGDMLERIIDETARMGISDRILFPGFVRGIQKYEMYRTADLFVMPSASEPFGIVPLESLINSTPVLISNQSGVSEILNHALKADFWDEDEMVNKILTVLKYNSMRNTLSHHGRIEAMNATWDKAGGKVKKVYDELMEMRM